ncbi:translationally-controlled tumor-like protein [Histomonas meleagridis]|uniref:translationally-controlled tumor-like protein n=1 Tax=Histomonas meleagridis TaxID=135588 RepID=UPI003559DCF5|nr:translationally-controlled tumor-like protein [Histomonas meleagridis]KAH0803763.1 translationally-controlled tumor-like protein [Histomonas meleagridis]
MSEGKVRYKDIFTNHVFLDERYPFQEDQEKGVYVVRGKFKAIFNEELPPENPNSVEVVINLVRDFGLEEINWTKDKLILWAKDYVQLIKQQHQLNTIEQSNPFVLSFAHLVRWVSAKFRDFHFFRPPGDQTQTVIFCSFLEDEITPVFWFPKWSVVKDE